jgi:hypothetical protein
MNNPIKDINYSRWARIPFFAFLVILLAVFLLNRDGKQVIRENQVALSPRPTQIVYQTMTPFGLVTPQKWVLPTKSISIDKMIEYSDRYYIQGHIALSGNQNYMYSIDISKLELFDINGKEIPIIPFYIPFGNIPHQVDFGFYTKNKDLPAGKLTLSSSANQISIRIPDSYFEIDYKNHTTSQGKFVINKDFSFEGHNIHISSAEVFYLNNEEPYLRITMEGDKNLRDIQIVQLGNYWGFKRSFYEGGHIINEFKYNSKYTLDPGYIADVKFQLLYLSYIDEAKLQVSWLPKENYQSGALSKSEIADACITGLTFKEILSRAEPSIPTGLSGNLLLTTQDDLGEKQVGILSLPDLSGPRILLEKENVSEETISMDSKYLAYYDSTDESIHINNLSTGKEFSIRSVDHYISNIDFSSKTKIFYSTGYGNIFSYDIASSKLEKVNNEPLNIYIGKIAVLSDQKTLLVQAIYPKGESGPLLEMNTVTGVRKVLNDRGILLLDNSQEDKIIFYDRLNDINANGVFISNFDNSKRRLLFFTNGLGSHPSVSFSSDGKWAIISTSSYYMNLSETNILVDLSTCDFYNLDIGSWLVKKWVN